MQKMPALLQGSCTKPPNEEQLQAMNLTGADGAAPLRELWGGQCVVAGDRKFLGTFRGAREGDTSAVTNEWHHLWLSNLYFRYKTSFRQGLGSAGYAP